jgi:hypothetical protein
MRASEWLEAQYVKCRHQVMWGLANGTPLIGEDCR